MQYFKNEYVLNVTEIMNDWYVYGGYNRKDLKNKTQNKKYIETNLCIFVL